MGEMWAIVTQHSISYDEAGQITNLAIPISVSTYTLYDLHIYTLYINKTTIIFTISSLLLPLCIVQIECFHIPQIQRLPSALSSPPLSSN